MFNLSKETLIAGAAVLVAATGMIAGDIAISKILSKRRVAALMGELKLTIKEFYIEASSRADWLYMNEKDKAMKLERLIAHEILNVTNLLDPKVVSSLRQEVSDEIKKIVAE